MLRSLALSVVTSLLFAVSARADVSSGPAVGTEVTELTVYSVTGDVQNEEVDFVAHREGKPTLYCFVPADKWNRPTARLLKSLDGRIGEVDPDAALDTGREQLEDADGDAWLALERLAAGGLVEGDC